MRACFYLIFLGVFLGPVGAQQQDVPVACAACPSLSLVPDDVDLAMVVKEPQALLQKVDIHAALGSGKLPLTSIALASSQGNGEVLRKVLPLMAYVFVADEIGAGMEEWAEWAESAAGQVIHQQEAIVHSRVLADMVSAMEQVHVRPVYGVMGCCPGGEQALDEWMEKFLQKLRQVKAPSGFTSEIVDVRGFRGVRFQRNPDVRVQREEWEERLAQDLDRRAFYVLQKRVGSSLITVFCENPDEIRLAASPEESLAARGELAERGILAQPGLVMALYASPMYMQAQMDICRARYGMWASSLAEVFKALAARFPQQEPVYTAAASGAAALLQQALVMYPDQKSSIPLLVWGRQTLRETSSSASGTGNTLPVAAWDVNVEYDAGGREFESGLLFFQEKGQKSSDTIFYAESTPCRGGKWPNVQEVMNAVCSLVRGLDATATPEFRQANAARMELLDPFSQVVENMVAGWEIISQGLNGSSAWVLDASGQLPPTMGVAQGETPVLPRLAYVSEVSDRGKLDVGWRQMMSAAGQGLGALGMDPSLVWTLPITVHQDGFNLGYSLELPWFSGDLTPQVLVSPVAWVLGTSSALNRELMSYSVKPGTPYRGCVFTFRPGSLARTLESHASMPWAYSLRDATVAARRMADAFEEISGQYTIEEGRACWRIHVQFR